MGYVNNKRIKEMTNVTHKSTVNKKKGTEQAKYIQFAHFAERSVH